MLRPSISVCGLTETALHITEAEEAEAEDEDEESLRPLRQWFPNLSDSA